MRTIALASGLATAASLSAIAIGFGGCSSAKAPDPTSTTTEDLYGLGSLAAAWAAARTAPSCGRPEGGAARHRRVRHGRRGEP
jgi:hypothetical protein